MLEKIINKIPYVVKLLNKIEMLENVIQTHEAWREMTDSGFKYLNDEIRELKATVESYKETHDENNMLEEVEKVPVTTKPELKIYKQNSASTVRYYYKNEYLFSAPESYFEKLNEELNNVLIMNPDLDMDTVKINLITSKNMLLKGKDSIEAVSEEGGC